MTPVDFIAAVDIGADEIARRKVGAECVGLVGGRVRPKQGRLVDVVGVRLRPTRVVLGEA